LRLTADKHKASRGLSATAELLVRFRRLQDVHLSVCLSHADVLSRRLNISSKLFNHSVATPFGSHTVLVFPCHTVYGNISTGPPNGGVECRRRGIKYRDFRPVTLSRNDASESCSYNDRLVVSRM